MLHGFHARPLLASGAETACLWGIAATHYAAHGLDWPTLATVLGGAGTCLMGLAAVLKQARELVALRMTRPPEPNPDLLPYKRG